MKWVDFSNNIWNVPGGHDQYTYIPKQLDISKVICKYLQFSILILIVCQSDYSCFLTFKSSFE